MRSLQLVALVSAVASADPTAIEAKYDTHTSITNDGSRVVIPMHASGGARGFGEFDYDVVDRAGKLVRRVVVWSDAQAAFEQDGADPALVANVAKQRAAADAFVAALDRDAHLVAFASDPIPAAMTVALAANGTLTVKPPNRAVITRHSDAWRATSTTGASLDGAIACFNPATLERTELDLARRIAVVWIGYAGNDTCWEPDPVYVVVGW